MFLPKKRLAELLEERDAKEEKNRIDSKWIEETFKSIPRQPNSNYLPPCYAPDGICTNPFHDCMDCPRLFNGSSGVTTFDGTDIKPIEQ